MRMLFLCSLLAVLALSACSLGTLVNTPVSRNGFTLVKDVTYGTDARQKLDVYMPKSLTHPAPVIVFFYGGSWQTGAKKDYLFVAERLTSQGFVVVIPDYRLYPQVTYPSFNEDAAQAVAWVHAHAAEYHADADNLFVMGHSAGAYIALMMALNESYIKNAGGTLKWIKGAIGLAGPYDFLPIEEKEIKSIFEVVPDVAITQPIHYAGPGKPPVLLLHGEEDERVYPRNSRHLAAALRKAGSSVEDVYFPDTGHITIILEFHRPFYSHSTIVDNVVEFIHRKANKQ